VAYNVAVRAYNGITNGVEVSTTVEGRVTWPDPADSVAAIAAF
jgi:hypothetical protein